MCPPVHVHSLNFRTLLGLIKLHIVRISSLNPGGLHFFFFWRGGGGVTPEIVMTRVGLFRRLPF